MFKLFVFAAICTIMVISIQAERSSEYDEPLVLNTKKMEPLHQGSLTASSDHVHISKRNVASASVEPKKPVVVKDERLNVELPEKSECKLAH